MLNEASLVSPANAMQYAVIRSNEFNSMFLFNTAKLLAAGSKASTRTTGLKPAYRAKVPMLAPISQKTASSGNASIHSIVSGSWA